MDSLFHSFLDAYQLRFCSSHVGDSFEVAPLQLLIPPLKSVPWSSRLICPNCTIDLAPPGRSRSRLLHNFRRTFQHRSITPRGTHIKITQKHQRKRNQMGRGRKGAFGEHLLFSALAQHPKGLTDTKLAVVKILSRCSCRPIGLLRNQQEPFSCFRATVSAVLVQSSRSHTGGALASSSVSVPHVCVEEHRVTSAVNTACCSFLRSIIRTDAVSVVLGKTSRSHVARTVLATSHIPAASASTCD